MIDFRALLQAAHFARMRSARQVVFAHCASAGDDRPHFDYDVSLDNNKAVEMRV